MDEVIKRLRKRDDIIYNCDYYGDCSTWYNWGRWIFVAGIIIAFFILFSLCLCITRRRRRRGLQPYYGTAWMPFQPTNPGNNSHQFQQYPQQQYDPNQAMYYAPTTAPAPPYTPSTGTHYNTPPPQTYYPPPPGAPPMQHGGMMNQNTGGTGRTEYYLPPPGPPPAAHVGKI